MNVVKVHCPKAKQRAASDKSSAGVTLLLACSGTGGGGARGERTQGLRILGIVCILLWSTCCPCYGAQVSLDLMSVGPLLDPSVSTHLGQPAALDG